MTNGRGNKQVSGNTNLLLPEKKSSGFGVAHKPLGNLKDNLLLLSEASGDVQRGTTLLAYWSVFSGARHCVKKMP